MTDCSETKKLLYIDVPFEKSVGGDKNRSRFLHDSLYAKYDVDQLLITDEEPPDETALTLRPCKSGVLEPNAVYSFEKNQIVKFRQILAGGQYDIVFVRFCSPARLARIAQRALPYAKIVIDVDMLFSRLASQSWAAARSLKNRYFLFEKYKLIAFESRLFREPYLFLFSNPGEKRHVLEQCAEEKCPGAFTVLPNVMRKAQAAPDKAGEPYILFFGTLNSTVNEDAFNFMAHEIYPQVSEALDEKGASICVAGKNQTGLYSQLCRS